MKTVLLLVLFIDLVLGYGAGPPPDACGQMKPGHTPNPTSGGDSKYEIICSKYTYSPNEVIQITLRGKGSEQFKGFLIEPRKTSDINSLSYKTVGSISNNPDNTRDPCADSSNTALSHIDSNLKSSITFSWTAPATDVGSIQFKATVVFEFKTYYMGLTSLPLTFLSSNNPVTDAPTNQPTDAPTDALTDAPTDAPTNPPATGKTNNPVTDTPTNQPTGGPTNQPTNGPTNQPTNAPTNQPTNGPTNQPTDVPTNQPTNGPINQPTDAPTDAATDAPTNPPATGKINRDPACEDTNNCFPSTSSCSTDCDYLVTWSAVDDDEVEFSLARKTDGSLDYYIAIGFSGDRQMKNASVVGCIANNGEVGAKVSFNDADNYFNRPMTDVAETFGITQTSQSLVDGILRCTFKRKRNAVLVNAALGRRRRAVDGEAEFFDLTSQWYLIVAHGKAFQGSVTKHSESPEISLEKIDFFGSFSVAPTRPPAETSGISRDPACEDTKNCYPSTSSCSTDCDYLVTWSAVDDDEVEFSLARKTDGSLDYYIAIGFSGDSQMKNASVIGCIANNGEVGAKVSFNDADNYFNRPMTDVAETFGITQTSQSLVDGILRCTFKRKRNAVLANAALGRRRRAVDGEAEFFDLTSQWYLIVAHGKAFQGSVSKHTESPERSLEKIDFFGSFSVAPTRPPAEMSGVIQKDKECGSTVGCYHDCDGDDNCEFLLTWVDEGDDVAFTLACKRGNDAYCAIGLSSDDKMGDDSVFECVEFNGQVNIHVSYNPSKYNERLSDSQFGLTVSDTSHVDGVLKCEFKRKKTYALQQAAANTGRKKRAAPAPSNFFDMNEDWYLLYAYGNAGPGNVDKHSMSPIVSSVKADLQSFMDIGGAAKSRILIKVHGILMIVAWMVCASVGIVIAKFYKPVWPEGQDWCGQRRWFVIHRSLMVLTVLCTAVAFVLIFIHVGDYSEIVGTNFQKAHPIIGIVVMALALINPTVAICRPHPGTPKRIYFNVFHGFVGGAAHTCSIVNIFAGTMLASANVSDEAVYILYAFVGWFGLAYISLVLYDCHAKKGGREEAYEMKGSNSGSGTHQKPTHTCKLIVLLFHVLIVVGLAAGLCVLVFKPLNNE